MKTGADRKVQENRARDTSAGIARKAPESAGNHPFTVKHAKAWAKKLILDNGEPWNLEPFQTRFLADVFSGKFMEALLVIPEGNAKTTFVGGLLLYHLEHQEYARVVVAASSRDQAEWLYQAAAGFVERSELKQFRCQEGYRRIRCDSTSSRAQIFAADDRTGDGVIPTLAILEELHRHRNLNLYRTWRGKLEKRGGQLISISTAGEPDGEFEALRKTMRESGDVIRKGSFLRAVGPNSVLHEYAVPEDRNPEDLTQVLKANPLKAVTRAVLERKKSSPAMTPAHWRRFVCGMPARLESWLSASEWDVLKIDVGGVAPGDEVYVGVRIGAEIGIGLASLRGEGVAVKMIPIPAPVGSRVPLRVVEGTLRELALEYDVRDVAYDPDHFARSAELLIQEGLPMSEVFQSPKKLTQATATFWRLVSGKLLSHDGDMELRRQVLAGRTKETQQGWRLEPTADTAGLIAVLMAAHQATDIPPELPMVYAL
jgi:phage terminase large subunit-like protein